MFYKSTWVICKLICRFYKPNIIPVSNKVKFNFISKWFIWLLICRISKLFSVVDAEFAPTTHGILVARLPSKLWHIMIYLSLIVTAYRTSSIKQAGKQIALNVSHFSSILPQAGNYILHMGIIKLQEFAFHKILWIHISCDGNLSIFRQNCLQNQVKSSLHHLLVIWMSQKKAVILNILLDDFSISF